MENKTDFIEKILEWCKLAGIEQNGDRKQFLLWKDLMMEELAETLNAYPDDKQEQTDGLADLIWITCNWAHMNNLDLISMLKKVEESNYSKFCKDQLTAMNTVAAYKNGTHWDKQGVVVDCYYEYVEPYYIVKRSDGKVLKSIDYKSVKSIE